jgi:UDPglucose 6-dehydrogenase
LVLAERLIDAGARVKAYDPVAMDSFRDAVPRRWFDEDQLTLVANQYEAVAAVDGLALVTEWRPFRLPDFAAMKRAMKLPVLFDGRNQFDPKWVRAEGFEYFGIGR